MDAFAVKAKVVKQHHSALTLEMVKESKKTGVLHKAMFPCDLEDVVIWEPEAMEPLPRKPMNQLNRGEKRFMVKQVWGNSAGSLQSSQDKQMLTDEDLRCSFEYLQWQYQLPEFHLFAAAEAKFLCYEGLSSEEGVAALLRLKELLKHMEYVVIPIHADSPLHWTCLVLHCKDGAVVENLYFDWLPTVQSNAAFARKLLRFVTLEDGAFMKLSSTRNLYRQKPCSNDCGFVVWYALELLMKRHRGEGDHMLYPDPVQWRKTLHAVKQSLYEEQQKWKLEVAAHQKPKFAITLPGEKIVDKKAYDKEVAAAWKAGTLKHNPKQFFTCSACRWSISGEGCFNCNPKKAENVKKDREKQKAQLKIAMEKAMEAIQPLALPADEVYPEDKHLEAKSLSGGGNITPTQKKYM